jgi:hypothetical protein
MIKLQRWLVDENSVLGPTQKRALDIGVPVGAAICGFTGFAEGLFQAAVVGLGWAIIVCLVLVLLGSLAQRDSRDPADRERSTPR